MGAAEATAPAVVVTRDGGAGGGVTSATCAETKSVSKKRSKQVRRGFIYFRLCYGFTPSAVVFAKCSNTIFVFVSSSCFSVPVIPSNFESAVVA